ncbi:hypothetical protein ISS07_03440 [Candidatus Woesearchaeota archaeon]|nr:hypothetical protein [Candidatus Woesearchaeota archaeon]
MRYDANSLLNPNSVRIKNSFEKLESLRRINGGYIAAPNPGNPDGTGRYDVFWLRDIMYATYANEYLGNMKPMMKSYELIMTIMSKYHQKIESATKRRSDKCVLHARYHPYTLEELSNDWGHNQLDVLGHFLYKTGDLIKKGHNVIKTEEQKELLKDIIQYLFTYRWETNPDFGVWEEGPELHSSSVGAVLAGLTMWFDDGHYEHKYQHKTDLSKIVPVSDRYFDTGWDSLSKLLPRESKSRKCDFIQLSLIWPYNIVDEGMKLTILNNVERNLVREKGVIRYDGDHYFNSNNNDSVGNEAQWPLGIAWLAIVMNKMASWNSQNLHESLDYLKRAKYYLLKMDELMVDGTLSELYVNGQSNKNKPLGWAHSFHVIGLQSFLNTLEEIKQKHNVQISEELEIV